MTLNRIFLPAIISGFMLLFSACGKDADSANPAPRDTTASLPPLGPPPAALNLDTFYKKYIDADGIPVVSSSRVPDAALRAVRQMVNKMLVAIPQARAKMIENKIRVGIMAATEVTTDMPEHRGFPQLNWARGLGATVGVPLSSCAEENVLCYPADVYSDEDIFVHEFAHSIHLLGLNFINPNFDAELQQTYAQALSAGLWTNTYAASNRLEYFAEGVQSWFNLNAQRIPTNGVHNHVNTRAELQIYDPGLFALISRYFLADNDRFSCHH